MSPALRVRAATEFALLEQNGGTVGHPWRVRPSGGQGEGGGEEEAGLRHVLGFEAEVADLSRGRLGAVVQDRGVHDAGQDRREAHAVLVLFEARRVGELSHPGFGGLVGGARHVRPEARDATDEDDETARGAQVRESRPDRVEGAAEVHRDHGVPTVGGELLEAPLGEVHPRSDDENVYSVGFADFLDGSPDRFPIRDVERVGDDPPSYALLYSLPAPRGSVHPGAGVGEEVRGREPDPTARTYDERRLSRERSILHHTDPARKNLIRLDGPLTSSAKALGPSSNGKTGGNSPMPARPSTSQSSPCS